MRIGRYEVVGEIARGGFGAVVRGRDAALGRDVAIKILLVSGKLGDHQRKRFEREVNALVRLRHPNIVSVHEAGMGPQGPYVVMDLIEGESLDDRLAREGPLPVRDALRIMEVVTAAIAHAHEQGVLHRDLKPANVLIDRLGNPFVTDFGLARDIDPRFSAEALSRTGASIGTPGFWPPEQAWGQLDKIGPRSDVYSLGATLYALLTGQAPYEAESIVEVLGLMSAPAPRASSLRPELSQGLDDLLARALALRPEDRFESVAALGEALTDVRRRTSASGVNRATSRERGRRGPDSGPPRALLGGLALLVLVIVGGAAALALALRPGAPAPAPKSPPPSVTTPPPPSPTPPTPPATETAPRPPERDPAAELEGRYREAIGQAEAAFGARQIEEAARALVVALELRPDDRRARLLHARMCLEGLQPAVAADSASVILATSPDDVDALVLRARARRDLHEPVDVLADVARALELDPDSVDALGLRAWARHKLGDTDRALEDWTRAIQLRPSPDLLCEVGNVEFELGHLEIAEEDFENALLMEPDHLLALLNLAAVHAKREQYERARELLDRAVRFRPDHSVPWMRRGDIRRLLDDAKGAVADLNRAIELDPSFAEAWRARGLARTVLGDAAGAVADHLEAARLAPADPDLHRLLGSALHEAGDTAGALRAMERALELDPAHAMTYFSRGVIREDLKDDAGATADYDRAIQLQPDHAGAHFNRALVRARAQDLAGARAGYDRVLELEPDHAECLLTRGDLRRRTDDLDGALADTARALELAPDHPKAQLAAALARHAKGGPENLRDAERLYTRYLEQEATNARILCERGRCREALGDTAGALADYEQVMKLVPEGPDNVHAWARSRAQALRR